MKNSAIVFCYRKIIDVSSSLPWEKMVFEDSYMEFKMQFQNFNQGLPYHTFAELVHQRPDAERLHFLVSPAVSGYIQQLQGRMPDLFDALGKHFLNFNSYKFELINSDIRAPSLHQVAISFYSDTMTWHDTIGNFLLVSDPAIPPVGDDGTLLTSLYQLQPFVSIHSLKLNV